MHVIALQNELDQLRTEYGDADLRANTLGKQVAMLTQQLEESHASVQDETKSKLALQLNSALQTTRETICSRIWRRWRT
ncbi:hypothetical protein EB796_013725 [Bugula neritina]|uniref:Uncharacterized protein n=1 Tax=Bugula neritina TaxID=10212 RepID=A0A7J7JQR0_BUGNE|nr:hypothetical protein EB796_013725 [Bugula neritina]